MPDGRLINVVVPDSLPNGGTIWKSRVVGWCGGARKSRKGYSLQPAIGTPHHNHPVVPSGQKPLLKRVEATPKLTPPYLRLFTDPLPDCAFGVPLSTRSSQHSTLGAANVLSLDTTARRSYAPPLHEPLLGSSTTRYGGRELGRSAPAREPLNEMSMASASAVLTSSPLLWLQLWPEHTAVGTLLKLFWYWYVPAADPAQHG